MCGRWAQRPRVCTTNSSPVPIAASWVRLSCVGRFHPAILPITQGYRRAWVYDRQATLSSPLIALARGRGWP